LTSIITYSGHYLDRATGLNLSLYRAYDAPSGRWLSRDPIGLGGGPNVYGYVLNNPVNGVDPFGLDALDDLSEFERLGGLDYLASFGVGILDKIPLWAGMSPSLGTVAKLAGLGGRHRCSANGSDPAAQGEKDGATAAAAATAIGALVASAPQFFQNLQCDVARDALIAELQKLDIPGQILEVRTNAPFYNIISDLSGGGKVIGSSYHTAVQVGDTVYDITSNWAGAERAVWEKSLHTLPGFTITSTPF